MRARHIIVELTEADAGPSCDLSEAMGAGFDDDPELIDESVAPHPILSSQLSGQANRPASRPSGCAIPTSQPISHLKPILPWGLGTDGWPRHNSRLVRLFACEPAEFTAAVAGRDWGCLALSPGWRLAKAKQREAPGWPRLVDGTMQMPYRSWPLEIELHVQPFHDRYARVDVILTSRRRWPRQYFDVASRCLTEMHQLERRLALAN